MLLAVRKASFTERLICVRFPNAANISKSSLLSESFKAHRDETDLFWIIPFHLPVTTLSFLSLNEPGGAFTDW